MSFVLLRTFAEEVQTTREEASANPRPGSWPPRCSSETPVPVVTARSRDPCVNAWRTVRVQPFKANSCAAPCTEPFAGCLFRGNTSDAFKYALSDVLDLPVFQKHLK